MKPTKLLLLMIILSLFLLLSCGATSDYNNDSPSNAVDTITLYSYGQQVAQYQAQRESTHIGVSYIVFKTTDGRAVTWNGQYLVVGANK